MLGYWGDPELTRSVLTDDGWYRTGDLVEVDDEGYVRVVGRLTDVIIRGGANVSPAEVEAALVVSPDVRYLIAQFEDGVAWISDLANPDAILGELCTAPDGGAGFAFTPDGAFVIGVLNGFSVANNKLCANVVRCATTELIGPANARRDEWMADPPAPPRGSVHRLCDAARTAFVVAAPEIRRRDDVTPAREV